MYAQLLVDLGHFDQINIGFLVVNHTHAPIDQKFSAIGSRIQNAQFIASPEALHKLLAAASSSDFYFGRPSEYATPTAQYRISVVHDYKEVLEPYFDNAVTHYGTPFNFKIVPIGGVSTVQAQMFVGSEWFPKVPREFTTAASIDAVFERPVFSFPFIPLAGIGGKQKMYDSVGIDSNDFDVNAITRMDEKRMNEIYSLNKIIPVLQVSSSFSYY
jgi:hypothetical protein